jgi:hypothetical protein
VGGGGGLWGLRVHVGERACVRGACLRACTRECVRVCVCVYVCVWVRVQVDTQRDSHPEYRLSTSSVSLFTMSSGPPASGLVQGFGPRLLGYLHGVVSLSRMHM